MSGLELVAELKGDPDTAGIPVLLLTAKAQQADIAAGIDAGRRRLRHEAVRAARPRRPGQPPARRLSPSPIRDPVGWRPAVRPSCRGAPRRPDRRAPGRARRRRRRAAGRDRPRAPGPPGARRLVVERRAGHRPRPPGATRASSPSSSSTTSSADAAPPRHEGRAGRPRLRQLPPRRRLAPRRPRRGRRPAGADGWARPDLGRRRAGAGRVRVGQPDRPGARRQRLVRLLRRLAWPGCSSACGHVVHREYYVNDTGGQIRRLGESVLARKAGRPVPEDGYTSAFVKGLAAGYDGADDVVEAGPVGRRAHPRLHQAPDGAGEHPLRRVVQPGVDRGEPGAASRRSTLLEREGPRVRGGRRRSGCAPPTSAIPARSGCCASRTATTPTSPATSPTTATSSWSAGFDRVINVWGADHQGQVPSLLAGVEALGVARGKLEVRLGQMVSIDGGRIGKRLGNAVDLDDLVDDIGPDVMRLPVAGRVARPGAQHRPRRGPRRSRGSHRSSTCSTPTPASPRSAGSPPSAAIERAPLADVDLALLVHERELEVLRTLEQLPEVIELAVRRAGARTRSRRGCASSPTASTASTTTAT